MSENQKTKDGKGEVADAENQAQTPSGIANSPIQSEMSPTLCNKGGENNHKKPIHEWIKYFVEIFGILGGLIGLVVLIFQYCETAKTTKVLSGQLHEMQTASILDERAWVFTGSEITQSISENKDSGIFYIPYANSGKTPALNIQSVSHVATDQSIIPKKDDYPSVPNHQGLCAPGQGAKMYTGIIPAQMIAGISDGKPLYVYGTIWYDDIFGDHHWSQFCIQAKQSPINKNIINFDTVQIHNSCDNEQSN